MNQPKHICNLSLEMIIYFDKNLLKPKLVAYFSPHIFVSPILLHLTFVLWLVSPINRQNTFHRVSIND